MKLFNTVDEKLRLLGFEKTEDNEYFVSYERYDYGSKYIQKVCIGHKKSGRHIIQSYDKTNTTKDYSPVVGLTYHENKLFLKKMKQKGWTGIGFLHRTWMTIKRNMKRRV